MLVLSFTLFKMNPTLCMHYNIYQHQSFTELNELRTKDPHQSIYFNSTEGFTLLAPIFKYQWTISAHMCTSIALF